MKILLAIPSMGMGGSETVFTTLLRHFDTRQFEAHLAVLRAAGPRLQDVPSHVPVHELHVKRARNAVIALARLCWKIRPRVILSTSAHMNSAVVIARKFMPPGTVLFTREGAEIHAPEHRNSRLRLLAYQYAYRQSDIVVCQSEHMRNTLIERFTLSPSKVVTIYNPVDIGLITNLAKSEPDPLPPGDVNLVSVGRHSFEKGFDLLLRAMLIVHSVLPRAVLTLIGEGPDDPMLRDMQAKLGLRSCVRFAGLQRNPYPYILNARCLVLPSRTEALPNVVLEALALGTPAVVSPCAPALKEIAGCTDQLYMARSAQPEALSAEILACIEATGTRAQNLPEGRFSARFGADAVVRKYEHLFSMAPAKLEA